MASWHRQATTDEGDQDEVLLSNEFPSAPLDDSTLESPSSSSSPNFLPLLSVILSNVFLFCLIFGLSATVQVKQLRNQLQNKVAIGTGIMMQFIIMPFLGFLAVVCMQHVVTTSNSNLTTLTNTTTTTSKNDEFTYAMGITLLVVTSSPGGSYSNWWCSVFNADLALSVAMTSISSILSIAFLPANLLLYTWLTYDVFLPKQQGSSSNASSGVNNEDLDVDNLHSSPNNNIVELLDFKSLFLSLGVVLGGIGFGLYASSTWSDKYPKFRQHSNQLGSFSGVGLILFSIAASSSSGGGDSADGTTNVDGVDVDDMTSQTNIFLSLPWMFYVGVAFPCVCGVVLANILSRLIGKLSHPECVTLSIECCYQNTAIGASVALTMFSADKVQRTQAVSVPLFYGIVEALLIGCYCVYAWKMGWTKAPKDEKICVVMTKTYEGSPDETDDDGVNKQSMHDAKNDKPPNEPKCVLGDEEEGMVKDMVCEIVLNDPSKLQTRPRSGTCDRYRCYSTDATVATTSSVLSTPTSPISPHHATINETEIILLSSP